MIFAAMLKNKEELQRKLFTFKYISLWWFYNLQLLTMPKKKTPGKKKTTTKKDVKKITKKKKVTKPKPKPLKKPAATKKPATVKRKPVPNGSIPLTLSLGEHKLHGYLTPLPQLAPWGGPEAFDIFMNNEAGKATISYATGAWVIQNPVQLPEQMKDDIILTIQVYYNGKGFNTPG